MDAAVFIVALLALLLLMKRSIGPYDEAIILVGAERVQEGEIPYRDFYANYGPASFYILAGLFQAFGRSVLVERAWDLTVHAATVLVAWKLVGAAAPSRIAWACAALVTIWLAAIETYAYPIWPCLFCSLTMLLCVHRASSSPRQVWSILAGALAGSTALFRFDVGLYTAIALCISVALSTELRLASTARRLAMSLLGVAIVCCPVAAALAVSGAIPDLVFDNVVFPARSYAATRSLPFPTASALMAHIDALAIYEPLVAVPLSIVVLALTTRRDTAIGRRRTLWWIIGSLASLSALFYLKGIVRVSVLHMALSFVPSLLLVAVTWPRVLSIRNRIVSCAVAAAMCVSVVVPSVWALGHDIHTARANIAWAADRSTWSDPAAASSCASSPSLVGVRCFAVDATWSEVVAAVERLSRKEQPIFVGLSRHDQLLINDMLIYFAADRRPATKWYHFDPGLQTSEPIQAEMIRDLQRSQPPVIVLDDTWSTVKEDNASSVSSGVRLLDTYLADNFSTVQKIGGYTIRVPRARA